MVAINAVASTLVAVAVALIAWELCFEATTLGGILPFAILVSPAIMLGAAVHRLLSRD